MNEGDAELEDGSGAGEDADVGSGLFDQILNVETKPPDLGDYRWPAIFEEFLTLGRAQLGGGAAFFAAERLSSRSVAGAGARLGWALGAAAFGCGSIRGNGAGSGLGWSCGSARGVGGSWAHAGAASPPARAAATARLVRRFRLRSDCMAFSSSLLEALRE